jgi:hypothetical protein
MEGDLGRPPRRRDLLRAHAMVRRGLHTNVTRIVSFSADGARRFRAWIFNNVGRGRASRNFSDYL